MTVWKNDVRLGVMQAKGLSGEFYWAAAVCTDPLGSPWGDSARIESAPLPG